jgi:hypothetical protein
MRKSGRKWSTVECGRCGEKHSNYSGKLDKNNIEYVVCGVTHSRMNVGNENIRDLIYQTFWIEEYEKETIN